MLLSFAFITARISPIYPNVEKRTLIEREQKLDSFGVMLFLDHPQFRKLRGSFKSVSRH